MPWTSEETIQKLREQYLRIEMPGMVALIDFLWKMEKAGTPVQTVGSSTIDLHGLTKCLNQSEQEMFETVFFRLKKLHFGSKHKPPIIEIAECGEILEAAPPEARKRIDEIVGEFARIGVIAEKILRHRGWGGNEPADFEEVDPMTADDEFEAALAPKKARTLN